MTVDLAAERAASEARQAERDRAHLDGMSPWARYCLWLYTKYPNNPISLLFFDARSTPYLRRHRASVIVGGDDPTVMRAWVNSIERPESWGHRIDRAAQSVRDFLRGLPDEDRLEAWLEREGGA